MPVRAGGQLVSEKMKFTCGKRVTGMNSYVFVARETNLRNQRGPVAAPLHGQGPNWMCRGQTSPDSCSAVLTSDMVSSKLFKYDPICSASVELPMPRIIDA